MDLSRGHTDIGLELDVSQEMGQRHTLSQLAVQTIRFLAMSQAEVDEVATQRIEANPAIQVGPPRRCRWCACVLSEGRCPQCSRSRLLNAEPGERSAPLDEVRRDARLEVEPDQVAAVDVVLNQLDDRGLLSADLDVIARTSACSLGDVEAAVLAIRAVAPPGTAARDVRASLLEQARWHVLHGGPDLVVPLVRDHLEAVASSQLSQTASELGRPRAEVEAAARFVRNRLTPAPLPASARADRPAQPPDVVITRTVAGDLVAHVLTSADLGLAVEDREAYSDLSAEAEAWWRERVDDARTFLDLLDRRSGTLKRIAEALVVVERDFILHGPRAHRPFTRTRAAKLLALHPSTVSRAVQNAVVAMPSGRCVAMADFFGVAVSPRACLAGLLESPQPPQTDAEAVTQLAAAGFVVARRTVAKYRKQLQDPAHRRTNIPSHRPGDRE